jgi:LVIVD repeat
MRLMSRFFVMAVLALGLLAGTAGATHPAAQHENMDNLFTSPTGLTNSDLAFWGDRAYVGNYGGFRIFDISNPASPTLLVNFPCFGPQNDVSVWDRDGNGEGDLLVTSIDSVLTDDACGSPTSPTPEAPTNWEGLRIFDVSDPTAPIHIESVYQDCGSHTHTMVPDAENNRVLIYNSSYSLRPGPTCGPVTGPANGRSPVHGVIQVVEISWDPSDPLAGVTATEIAEPPINYPGDPDNQFDPADRGLVGPFFPLRACHDIGVHLGVGLAAGACAEQTQLWRLDENLIPDTAHPIWVFDDNTDVDGPGGGDVAVDFWHTARFTWDGKFVQADDESFGDGCPPVTLDSDDTGRTHFLRTSSGARLSFFMIPRPEPDAYCSMHQGNMIPAPGRYLSVNAWYMGGVDIIDFTAPRNPREIAFFDFNPDGATGSDNWSHYWYEQAPQPGTAVITYGQDGVHNPPTGRGFEVFKATVGIGRRAGVDHLNPQTQEEVLP